MAPNLQKGSSATRSAVSRRSVPEELPNRLTPCPTQGYGTLRDQRWPPSPPTSPSDGGGGKGCKPWDGWSEPRQGHEQGRAGEGWLMWVVLAPFPLSHQAPCPVGVLQVSWCSDLLLSSQQVSFPRGQQEWLLGGPDSLRREGDQSFFPARSWRSRLLSILSQYLVLSRGAAFPSSTCMLIGVHASRYACTRHLGPHQDSDPSVPTEVHFRRSPPVCTT